MARGASGVEICAMHTPLSETAAAEREELKDQVKHILDESRVVLPGVQALFGFQLIAVFNQSFSERLTHSEQLLHLVALGATAIGMALVMAPAAYHRIAQPALRTTSFVKLATKLLISSMLPVVVGICIDFFIIARMITQSQGAAAASAALITSIFVILWFVVPFLGRLRHQIDRPPAQ